MMIKITESCSMGCTHCMNDAKPSSNHMSLKTFEDALMFHINHGGHVLMITGGEPTEHPQFRVFLEMALTAAECVLVTTNGVWMQDQYEYVKDMIENFPGLMWQVSCDKRYYPTAIDTSLPVFHLKNVELCDTVPRIYPQGRAADNNTQSSAKASKCFNIRAMTRQVNLATPISIIFRMMNLKGFFCTPHIAVNGDIKVGESDLCPPCSSIYKTEEEIKQDILNFRCHKCDHINNKLSSQYKALLGE